MTPNWSVFYDNTANRPARETLIRALDAFPTEGAVDRFAIDMGCGIGNDTRHLLTAGWRVLAQDAEPEAIERLRARIEQEFLPRLETVVARYEGFAPPAADLINASFALPFCRPTRFPAIWERIGEALLPGGRFSGQLFGVNDAWAGDAEMNFHTRAEVELLLEPFEIEFLEEVDRDGQVADGSPKHWHVFHIVARKPDSPRVSSVSS